MKKTLKKVVAITLASAMVTTVLSSTLIANAGSPIDEDFVFAPLMDFEGLETDINYNPDVPGMGNNEYVAKMWETDAGSYQVQKEIGRKKSNGFIYKNNFGPADGQGVWSALEMRPVYEESQFVPSILKYATIGAASEFCFWIDTTDWITYKLKKDEDGNVVGRESETPVLSTFSIWLALYDDGTSVGEGLSAYVPSINENIFIQDEQNGGWIEYKNRKDEYITVPKGYKGYVRMPRNAFHTIWGAHGDVLPSDKEEQKGDNLFNGPIQFIKFEHLAGGFGLENAQVVFDDFGFLAYEEGFQEDITTIGNLNEYFAPEKPAFVRGDINNDNKINTLDALLILKHIAKITLLTDDQLKPADYNEDNTVNTLDSLGILKFVANIK